MHLLQQNAQMMQQMAAGHAANGRHLGPDRGRARPQDRQGHWLRRRDCNDQHDLSRNSPTVRLSGRSHGVVTSAARSLSARTCIGADSRLLCVECVTPTKEIDMAVNYITSVEINAYAGGHHRH